jgi:hypothetical protein
VPLHASEGDQRAPARLRPRHPEPQILFRFHIDVETEFRIHSPIRTGAP